MKTLENIEYLFLPWGALSSYHQVVTKLHFQTQDPGVSVMIFSNHDPVYVIVTTRSRDDYGKYNLSAR